MSRTIFNVTNNYTAIREAIALQCMARFEPNRFNLEPGYVAKDDAERFAIQLLNKYHDKKLWQK
jgi:hypothetical protein